MKLTLFRTLDGSFTLLNEAQHVYYHSFYGAVGESKHVFLESTRIKQLQPPWHVLELGFGTGLNFLLTADAFLMTLAAHQAETLAGYRLKS